MNAKIRIKFGTIEIDCEGEESFVKSQIPLMIEKLTKLDISTIIDGTKSLKGTSASNISVTTLAQKIPRVKNLGVNFHGRLDQAA